MDEGIFWNMIEGAWNAVGGYVGARAALSEGLDSERNAYSLEEKLDLVIAALKVQLEKLDEKELLAFDRILERKLYDIDRSDIHERTDGSDDGFLYCRGFIVAMGQRYYEAVLSDPDLAVADAECQSMSYISWHLYHDRFGEMSPSGISRETTSNVVGWPDA
jgi:hypothetical protein